MSVQQTKSITSVYNNESRISETYYVPIASAIWNLIFETLRIPAI
jgi:hypothetical protein